MGGGSDCGSSSLLDPSSACSTSGARRKDGDLTWCGGEASPASAGMPDPGREARFLAARA
jgi:hypothetical protein